MANQKRTPAKKGLGQSREKIPQKNTENVGYVEDDGEMESPAKIPSEASWIDDVPRELISSSLSKQSRSSNNLVKRSDVTGPTKCIAMDCEFVGVGFQGKEDALARVSIVNQFGAILIDEYVRAEEKVVDYRTHVSGIRPCHLTPQVAKNFMEVHKKVAALIENRILVGHSIQKDLKVLLLSHPKKLIRDTSRYKPFRRMFNGATPSLKKLTHLLLAVDVQDGEHDSVQDARATMKLYTSVKKVWEAKLSRRSEGASQLWKERKKTTKKK